MLNEVYNRRILELAGNIPRLGRLAHPDASATAHSKLCGSTVTVDLKMAGDEVTEFAHEVKACALGQASSSIMARHVVGARADELRSLREAVRRMLKENGAPPAGKWADIAVLEPVRDYTARHASTLLTFDAVVDAIAQIEGKRSAKAAAGGPSDAYLVKFDNNGLRQWATYYGGVNDDQSYSCVNDVKGNIYLSGVSAGFSTNLLPNSRYSMP